MINLSGVFSKEHRSRNFIFLAILIFVLGCILHFFRGYYWSEDIYVHGWGVDDAYISFRYGWNLVHFGNLSWNETGFRRTEGFTNPLWVLLSALWSLPGNKDWVYPGVVASAVLFSSGLLFMAQRLILERTGKLIALVGVLILCMTPFMWADATSGLESVVFGLVLALLAYLAGHLQVLDRRRKIQLAGFAFIACLLRSDGAVYVAIVLAGLFFARKPALKQVLAGMLSASVLLYLFQYLCFGTFVPNTAIAKLNFGLMDRLPLGIEIFLVILMYGASSFLFMGFKGMRNSGEFRTQIVAACVLLGWCGYFIYIGGDTFRERHLVGAFAYAAMISSDYWGRQKLVDVVKTAGVLLVLLLVPLLFFDARFSYANQKPDDPMILLGKSIALDRERYGTIVIPMAGKTPFFAGGDFVDSLGLNDPYLATVKLPHFIPGHSAGSKPLAIDIARQHSPNDYSMVDCSPSQYLVKPEDVRLWVYGAMPADGVHSSFTSRDLQTSSSAQAMYFCVLIDKPH